MGLAAQLTGLHVALDTAPIIYFVEKHTTYLSVVRPVFEAIETGNIEAITSTVTLLEVLVHPLRHHNTVLAAKYKTILLSSDHFSTYEISHEISERASKLRAQYSIKTPDAIQIAGALVYGADKFLTNDADLKRITEINILVVDEFVP